MSYFVKDNPNPELWAAFECQAEHNEEGPAHIYEGDVIENRNPMGQVTLRTFKLALSCTGEYAQFHGGTKELVLAQMVSVVNRLTQVFERDLAIRAQLVENNDEIIFLDPQMDGLSNGNTGALLGEIANKINPIIGAAGVSAVPDSARVCQMVGAREDPTNFLIMHAMAPNVAGVIGSAVAAGMFLALLR